MFEFVQEIVAPVGEVVKLYASKFPPHSTVSAVAAMIGVGFTVIVNVIGVPKQPFKTGVTVTFAVWVVVTEGLTATEISPEPAAAMPTAVLSLLQLYVAAAWLPVKWAVNGCPPQTVIFEIALTVGVGFTVIWKVSFAPIQPLRLGVTTI